MINSFCYLIAHWLIFLQIFDRNEPVSDTALQLLIDGEKEHHKKIICNIVRSIQPRINDLHALLLAPPPVSITQELTKNPLERN